MWQVSEHYEASCDEGGRFIGLRILYEMTLPRKVV